MAQVEQQERSGSMDRREPGSIASLNKIPSLDFNRGLEATRVVDGRSVVTEEDGGHRQGESTVMVESSRSLDHNGSCESVVSTRQNSSGPLGSPAVNHVVSGSDRYQTPVSSTRHSYRPPSSGGVTPSASYEASGTSVGTCGTPVYDVVVDKGRRLGIPHSNICTICSTSIYFFKNRCLLLIRYIRKAGKVGCLSRYPVTVKQAELKWAEKGPRKNGERVYGQQAHRLNYGSTTPKAKTPLMPSRNLPPSYPLASPYSPYNPTHLHLPL